MTDIPRETVVHVAELARLSLTSDEVERYTQDLSKILQFVDQLNEVSFEGTPLVEGATTSEFSDVPEYLLPKSAVLRPDDSESLLNQSSEINESVHKSLMRNAPDEEDGFFRVPRILDQG
ncbi:MAG: Asp-tRNA(Asn)/Glu-tRNA(Gln) amidotransferase subunit GatC [Cyanobacteria bacterium]|nr:Asp-tRNA(Asn)/Glu-tRNA(Gln) amidotransferase subunit GatC [Cyanobacteriota bacterium]